MRDRIRSDCVESLRDIKNFDIRNFTWIIKNRVTGLWLTVGWISLFSYNRYQKLFMMADDLKTTLSDDKINELLWFYFSLAVSTGILWYIFLASTLLWYWTGKTYRAVKKKLDKNRNHDLERFFRTQVCNKEFLRVFWYCQLQGIYLAMKEVGREEEFFRLKAKYSKIIIPII